MVWSVVPSLTVRVLSVASVERTVTVAVSVPGAVPSEGSVARPITVRVKVSSVPAVSAGIVTTGVALSALSNVTPLVGPEVWLQL